MMHATTPQVRQVWLPFGVRVLAYIEGHIARYGSVDYDVWFDTHEDFIAWEDDQIMQSVKHDV